MIHTYAHARKRKFQVKPLFELTYKAEQHEGNGAIDAEVENWVAALDIHESAIFMHMLPPWRVWSIICATSWPAREKH